MKKQALLNASVYVGAGKVIPNGFVAWEGSTITAVGGVADLAGESGLERRDLSGGLILPGLVDSHLHLVGYALSLRRANLAGTGSIDEALGLIAASVARLPKGEWLKGRGWDKQQWGLGTFPDRWALDRVTPHNPAVLSSRDGHLVWVNSAALAALGLDRTGIQVEGGQVETCSDGRPTGIFKEKAANIVLDRLEGRHPEWAGAAVREACRNLIKLGITGVHTSENRESLGILDKAAEAGMVDLDVVRMLEVGECEDIDQAGLKPDVTHIKILADGALGSQTASMFQPYCGQPDNYGIASVPPGKLRDLVFRAVDRGFSVAVHAIGDRANRQVLDVFALVRGTPAGREAVLRIEHAQVLTREDIPRFGRLGIVASMQPVHLVGDMKVADKYWGARSRYAYSFRSILDAGGTLAFGSDAPIEDPDPLKGIAAAVMRRDPLMPDSPPWHPEERITLGEAVDAYTLGAGVAAGGRGTGRIAPGLRADLTVLDGDIFTARPEALHDVRVVMTVTGGRTHPQ